MLNLTIQGIQRSQAPAHLRPRRLPLTNTMLDTMFGLLDTDSLGTHDRLMLKAALSHGFFGLLRVCEFIITSRRALTQGHTPQEKTLPGPKAVSASSLNSPRLTRLAKEPQFQWAALEEQHDPSWPCKHTCTSSTAGHASIPQPLQAMQAYCTVSLPVCTITLIQNPAIHLARPAAQIRI